MSTLTKQTHHCLQKLKQCSTNQSYHLSKCNLSNSKNNLPYLIEQINWTHITFLNLSSNNLKDVSFLSSVGQMTTLNLSNNCLNSISVLIDCVHLISLDCSYNEITELPELNRLKFLEKLNASNNPLNSISGLWGCKNLRDLNLSACNLTSSLLSGLDENEIQLGAIDPFEKVSGLSNVSKLPNFPTTNHNLRPTLLGIPNLRILNLSYNPRIFHALCIQFNRQCGISNDTSMNNLNRTDCSMFNVLEGNMNDVNGFGLFPYKIEYLNLQACDINFINGLSHMKRLHTLNLSYNQIMDIQILK
ncbi:unnamed protein product [Trichobilharzia regenti]|nr:unnamed protein product [Trichobilharzia regenti]